MRRDICSVMSLNGRPNLGVGNTINVVSGQKFSSDLCSLKAKQNIG